MAHFKPFFYMDEDIESGDWKRIFVEPGKYGMVTMEVLTNNGTRVEFNLSPEKAADFGDQLLWAADEMRQDNRDWVGEEI
jgi:hypothetical protein